MLLDAGASTGKTVVLAELVRASGFRAVEVPAGDGLLLRRLQEQTHGARHDRGQDPPTIEAVAERLATAAAPVSLVVDDAHLLSMHEAEQLERLARRLPAPHRLLVAGRVLPTRLEDVGAAVRLGLRELALTGPELKSLLVRCGQDDPVTHSGVLESTGLRVGAVLRALTLLDEGLGAYEAGRRAVARDIERAADMLPAELADGVRTLAHLPRLDAAATAAAIGPDGVRRLLLAGLPGGRDAAGGLILDEAVRAELRRRGPPSTAAAAAIIRALVSEEELLEALEVLLALRSPDEAAQLLASAPPRLSIDLDPQRLLAVVEALPEETVRHEPLVLVHAARAARRALDSERRQRLLDRAAGLADEVSTVGTWIAVERLRQLAEGDAFARQEAVKAGGRLLRELQAEPPQASGAIVQAHLLDVLSRASAELRMEEARPWFEQSAAAWLRLGVPTQAALAHAARATFVDRWFDASATLERLDLAVELSRPSPRMLALMLTYRADWQALAGRLDAASADMERARSLARAIGDQHAAGGAEWSATLVAWGRGDALAVRAAVEATDRLHDPLEAWGQSGIEYLARAADALDGVGLREEGRALLARARARRELAPLPVQLAELAIEARAGDPVVAEVHARALLADRLDVLTGPRVWLLRALAADRRGEHEAARAHASRAVASAHAAGAEESLAVGDPGARHLLPPGAWPATTRIRLLGGVAVERRGEAVEVQPGRTARLLALLAAEGGRLPISRVLEVLWPDTAEDVSRSRLREVFYRLRRAVPEVSREHDVLVLSDQVEVDLAVAERAVALAVSGHETTGLDDVARALARPLLPEFLDDDAEELRRRARGARLAVLDLLAVAAAGRGDLETARDRWLEGIRLDPVSQERVEQALRALLAADRPLDVLAVVGAAESALADLDLPLPAALGLARSAVVRAAD